MTWESAIWESNVGTAIGHFPSTHLDVSELTAVPMVQDGPFVLRYSVPRSKRLLVKSILLTAYGPWQQTTSPPQNTGAFTFWVDGVTKAEWRTLDPGWTLGGMASRYKETTLGRGMFSPVGVTFTSGQALKIRLTPVNPNMPKLIHAWLRGNSGGQRVMEKTRTIVYGTATDVLTYTCTGNFTMQEFGAEGYHNDQNLIGYMRCDMNGRPVLEMPFMYSNDSLSKPPNVTLNFGTGIELSDEDTLEVRAANIYQMGCRYSANIFGTLSDIGVGGTTYAGYARSRVTNA